MDLVRRTPKEYAEHMAREVDKYRARVENPATRDEAIRSLEFTLSSYVMAFGLLASNLKPEDPER